MVPEGSSIDIDIIVITSVENNRACFINPRNQQGNSVRSGHGLLSVAGIPFSEIKHLVRNSLGQCLHFNPLVVHELVVLTLDSTVLNKRFSVCAQTVTIKIAK